MTTLTICFGMFLSICSSVRSFDYLTHADCEKARLALPQKTVGDGYAICAPKVKDRP
jgi:hypothetical protein